jgi:hypothetical protein
MATPAAPAPESTTRRSWSRLSTILMALRRAARATTAVPCWSSWNTGIERDSVRRASISKHCGAAMSSRLIPPNMGSIRCTVSTSSSGPETRRHTGTALTPPKALKSTALPSITGRAASGPMSPRPSTAVPSVTTATVLDFIVYSCTSAGCSAMAVQTRATPGV